MNNSASHERVGERLNLQRLAFASLALGLTVGAVGPSILRSAESPGMLFAAWRMLLGSVLYTVVIALRGKRLTVQMLRDGVLGGVFFGLSIGLFYAAIGATSVTNAVVIGALRPAIVVAVVGPIMKEKVNKMTVLWTLVAIGGATFAVLAGNSGDGDASFKGDAFALMAAFSATGYLLATKRGRKSYDSFGFTTAMMFSGTVVLFPLAAVTSDGIGLPASTDWKWILAMAAIPGAAHVLNNYSVAHLPLSIVSNATLLGPGIAAAYAWILIDERILRSDILGMIITIFALSMMVRTSPPAGN